MPLWEVGEPSLQIGFSKPTLKEEQTSRSNKKDANIQTIANTEQQTRNNKYNQTTCEQTHAHTNIKNTKNRTQKPTANIWRVLPGASKTGNQEKTSH